MDASHRRVMMASAVGSALEWYDFFIYGTAAALVFSELFFPKFDSNTGLLLSFATFGVGFFARPFGGMVFGHLGDRIGRKPFVIATFVAFAAFPIAVVLAHDFATLVVAFVVGGLREIGEPARKAMVTELAPPEFRTQAIGVMRGLAMRR